MKTQTVLKTIAFVSAFAVGAGSAHAGGLLGENYIGGNLGTTVSDEGNPFDDREFSLDLGVEGNLNVHPNVDLNLAYDYSRVKGDLGGERVRVRSHDVWLRSIVHGELTGGVTPYISAGVGWLYQKERNSGESDNNFQFGLGSGVELAFLPNTALRLGGEWRHSTEIDAEYSGGSLTVDSGNRVQEIVWQSQVSYRMTPDVSIVGSMEHGNTSNNTSFKIGANWHVDAWMR